MEHKILISFIEHKNKIEKYIFNQLIFLHSINLWLVTISNSQEVDSKIKCFPKAEGNSLCSINSRVFSNSYIAPRAVLLTTLILHLGGYDLRGLYSLEEYYAKNLLGYYRAISVGQSHNYYFGRAESDITNWIEYFTEGMAFAFEKVVTQVMESHKKGEKDHSELMRTLDPKQRKALELFREYDVVTSRQIGDLFGFQPRTNAALCKKWVESGFLEIADSSFKSRKYRISDKFKQLLDILI